MHGFYFTDRQQYIEKYGNDKYRGITWEWNNIKGFSFYSEKGKKLKRISKKAMAGIKENLKKFLKEEYPEIDFSHLLNQGEL